MEQDKHCFKGFLENSDSLIPASHGLTSSFKIPTTHTQKTVGMK
jgi:hypothetical protein